MIPGKPSSDPPKNILAFCLLPASVKSSVLRARTSTTHLQQKASGSAAKPNIVLEMYHWFQVIRSFYGCQSLDSCAYIGQDNWTANTNTKPLCSHGVILLKLLHFTIQICLIMHKLRLGLLIQSSLESWKHSGYRAFTEAHAIPQSYIFIVQEMQQSAWSVLKRTHQQISEAISLNVYVWFLIYSKQLQLDQASIWWNMKSKDQICLSNKFISPAISSSMDWN